MERGGGSTKDLKRVVKAALQVHGWAFSLLPRCTILSAFFHHLLSVLSMLKSIRLDLSCEKNQYVHVGFQYRLVYVANIKYFIVAVSCDSVIANISLFISCML